MALSCDQIGEREVPFHRTHSVSAGKARRISERLKQTTVYRNTKEELPRISEKDGSAVESYQADASGLGAYSGSGPCASCLHKTPNRQPSSKAKCRVDAEATRDSQPIHVKSVRSTSRQLLSAPPGDPRAP